MTKCDDDDCEDSENVTFFWSKSSKIGANSFSLIKDTQAKVQSPPSKSGKAPNCANCATCRGQPQNAGRVVRARGHFCGHAREGPRLYAPAFSRDAEVKHGRIHTVSTGGYTPYVSL